MPSESDFWSLRFKQHQPGMSPACTPSVRSRSLLIKLRGVDPQLSGRTTPRTTSAPPLGPSPEGMGGARRRRVLPLARASGGGGARRQRLRCVVIRRRLEDTIKMAAVSGLVRRPLEQVRSGTRDPCATPAHPSFPLSVLFISPPGLRAAEEALPPDSVSGAAGNWLGQ